MDFLLYSRDFDYSITEITSNSNVNFQTLKKLWPKLEWDKIVVSTRTMAGTILLAGAQEHYGVGRLNRSETRG